jgi:hypothetical protein
MTTPRKMGREASVSATDRLAVIPALEMRVLQFETALQQIGEQTRALVQQVNALASRVTSLETQVAAIIALHHEDVRRLQFTIGLLQTTLHGSRLARLRWVLGI